jgi:hypothetical protein
VTDDRNANLHLVKMLRTGTVATVDFLNERLDSNASFTQLRPLYRPGLNFSVVQPLLRNFGWDFSYLVVRVAEQAADAALYAYQAQLADFVELVIEAYWNVVRARETLEVQRESLALATRTVEENEARVKVGLLPPVARLEAEVDAKLREAGHHRRRTTSPSPVRSSRSSRSSVRPTPSCPGRSSRSRRRRRRS